MINLQDMIEQSRLFKTYRVDDLLFVQYQCYVKENQSPVWTHQNYLAYVLGGKKAWKTLKNSYTATSGEALFIRKGAHTVYQYFEEKFYVLFIFLPDTFIHTTLKKYPEIKEGNAPGQFDGDSVIPLSMNPVFGSFFQSLFSYFLQEKPPPKDLLRLKMEELILSIYTQPGNQSLKQYFLSLGWRHKIQLKEIMESNFPYPLSIEEYARLSARSLSTFRRDFKKIFHTSPGRWLSQKRLSYGSFLLETTDLSILGVAEECGFKNRSHFIRMFREKFGVSPHQYRIKHRIPEN